MEGFFHKPVMLTQVIEALKPCSGGTYVDGTLGGGGHAEAILRASSPSGWLYGCDRDGTALQAAEERLAPFKGRFEVRRLSFSEVETWIAPRTTDGVLLDLGVSSPQLDSAERGFSFQKDGPLDMRMDDRQSVTAETLLNDTQPDELARLFWELGGERHSRRIARAIETERRTAPIRTTGQLARLVERIVPRSGSRIHPATRVFQAVRIAVNDELGVLAKGLGIVWGLLKQGGRLAVITFHSLEDQIVKKFGRDLSREYEVVGEVDVPELRKPAVAQSRWVFRKPLRPEPEELADNPRSRSAQLRVMEKIA